MDFIGRVLAVLGRGIISMTFGVIAVCLAGLAIAALLSLIDALFGAPTPGSAIYWIEALPNSGLYLLAVLIASAVGFVIDVHDAHRREREWQKDYARVIETQRDYYAEEARRQSLWTDIGRFLRFWRQA